MIRRFLAARMVHHASRALACHAASRRLGFAFHRTVARILDRLVPDGEFACPRCGTRYFQPQECDWCPGRQAIPASNPATH